MALFSIKADAGSKFKAPSGENVFQKLQDRRAVATTLALAIAGGALMQSERPARADRRDFPFTQEWRQARKGEAEVEVKSTYRGKDNSFVQQFEVEYGVTDRLQIEPSLVFEKKAGRSYRYHEFKLEGRYRLGDYKDDKFLPALYLEYARERSGDDELEGKLIFSRYGRDGSNISLNLIAERALESGAKIEKVYSLGYARDIGKKGWRGGGEWIHNLTDHTINAGPVASYGLGDNIHITGGYAFALNKRNSNDAQIRLNVEYEF